MALVMAEKDQPVFRDFLGSLDRGGGVSKQHQQQHQQPEYTSTTATSSDVVVLRGGGGGGASTRSSVAFDSEDGDEGCETIATRSSSGRTSGRFETSSAPGYNNITPPFALALPSSSDPGSVGWQRCNSTSSSRQQQQQQQRHLHGTMRSAFFCKPDFDNSKGLSKNNKREYHHAAAAGVIREESSSSLQERLQMSVEAIENSRQTPAPKMARLDQEKAGAAAAQKYYGEVLPSIDDLRLSMQPSMQPPRLSSVSPPWLQQQQQQQPCCKPDAPPPPPPIRNYATKQLEVPRLLQSPNNSGLQVPPPPRISHLGACAEREERAAAAVISREDRAAAIVSRENTGMSPPIVTRPAADEGSRTGLKGSLLVGLINNNNNNNSTTPVPAGSSGPPPLPRRPAKPAPSGGSDSMLPSTRQGPLPATRQLLTIFYGGQAHVFDDVPSNKAEAILAMAGSHGKSWSTTYSHRSAGRVPDSASEGSLLALEKEKTVQSRGGPVSGGGRSSPLSTDMQTLLRRGCANTANGGAHPT